MTDADKDVALIVAAHTEIQWEAAQEEIDLDEMRRELASKTFLLGSRPHDYGDRSVWRPFRPEDPWSPLVNRAGQIVGAP